MGLKEIIPLLAAIIGLTPVFLKWMNDRSLEAAKRRSIEQAKEQVEFWQVWLKAQREVTNDERFVQLKLEVSQRLDLLLQKNIDIENEEKEKVREKEQGIEKHSFFQKLFLLYMPHTASGWIFHTFFYITISFTSMLMIGLSIKPNDPDANPSWEYFMENFWDNMIILIVLLVIALLFQRIARRSEHRNVLKLATKEN